MKLRITEVDAGIYAEGNYQETSFGSGSSSVTHDRLFLGPSLGLNMEGSIYHPYLFRFLLDMDGSYGWAQESIKSSGANVSRSKLEYLGRFAGNADFFANKPLSGNLNGTYSHTFRDYDFFNRSTVDSLTYGAGITYESGPFLVRATYSRQEEDASSLAGSSRLENDQVLLSAINQRHAGSTGLEYTLNRYLRGDLGRSSTGSDHSLSLYDNERFGPGEKYLLNSRATYSKRDSFDQPSDELNTYADLNIEHRPNLSSYHELTYDRYGTGDFHSENYAAQSNLRHQLYESLSSTLTAQASDNEFSASTDTGYARRFAVGFSESYTKHLGADHRVHASMSTMIEHVDRHSIGTIKNERHTFGAGDGLDPDSFFLNLPNPIEITIVVTDEHDNLPAFVAGIDYSVTVLGTRGLIQRLPGSRIPAKGVVLVDYETTPSSDGSYEALNESFQIRFDLWKNFVGIYARLNLYANDAPESMHVPNLTSYTLGTDVRWRWFRAGAEYEIYQSDQSDYQSFRMFQSAAFTPDKSSSIGLELSEGWTSYGQGRDEQNYRFIMLYHRAFTTRLRLDFDGGVHLRQGRGFDQTLATMRPNLNYLIGKTTIRAGYDFEYELFLNREERQKHMFYISAKRTF